MSWQSCIFRSALVFFAGLVVSPKSAEANDGIRLSFEWIELGLEDFKNLVSDHTTPLGGNDLRKKVERLVGENRAAVVRSAVVNSRSGHRVKGESIETYVYPKHFTIPKLSEDGNLKALPPPESTTTRNLGVSVEIDPMISSDGQTVEIHLSHELVSRLGNRTWGSGIAEVEMPEFYEMRGVTRLSLGNRETRLVGSLRPPESLRREGEETHDPRLLLFVTAHFAVKKRAEQDEENPDFVLRYEFIETEMALLNDWLVEENVAAKGPALHERFARAITEGEARFVETVVATGSSGKVELRSVREVPYPTDYEPPEVDRRVPAMPGAFDHWLVGLQIEFRAEWQENGTLHLSPEDRTRRGRKVSDHIIRWDHEIGEQRWMEGVAEVAFPLFYEMKLQQPINLVPGEVAFLGTLRPHSDDGTQPILAVFARAIRIAPFSPSKD